MRYVIFFATLAFFFIWDSLYNEARYFTVAVRTLVSWVRWLGL